MAITRDGRETFLSLNNHQAGSQGGEKTKLSVGSVWGLSYAGPHVHAPLTHFAMLTAGICLQFYFSREAGFSGFLLLRGKLSILLSPALINQSISHRLTHPIICPLTSISLPTQPSVSQFIHSLFHLALHQGLMSHPRAADLPLGTEDSNMDETVSVRKESIV